MKKYILTAILFVAFASARAINTGNTANTTAANTNQTSSPAASPANTTKPAESPTAETKADTSKKSSNIDTKGDEHIQFAKSETDKTRCYRMELENQS